MTRIPFDEWWGQQANVISLAYWLESRDEFRSQRDVIDFFRAPWSWGAEWDQMRLEERLEREALDGISGLGDTA